jgi:hypothetical protein
LRSNAALAYLAAMGGAEREAGLRRRSLAARFGFPETEHAVRLLRKVPRAWISSEFLAQLRAAVTEEPEADELLTHLGRINPITLEVARDPELRASLTPECIARLARIPASAAHCDLLARMRNFVASAREQASSRRVRRLSDLDRPISAVVIHGGAVEARRSHRVEPFVFPAPRELATPVTLPPPRPTRPEVTLPVSALAAVALPFAPRRDAADFPSPPLGDVDTQGVRIRAIKSRADLVAESDVMHHCAGREKSYARRVMNGRLYFYRMLEPERLTIAIRPSAHWWVVEEVRGVCNRKPSDAASFLIWRWITQRAVAAPQPAPRVMPNQLALQFNPHAAGNQ